MRTDDITRVYPDGTKRLVASFCCDICGWCDTCEHDRQTKYGTFDLCHRHKDKGVLRWLLAGAPYWDRDKPDLRAALQVVVVGHSGSLSDDPRLALIHFPRGRSSDRLRSMMDVRDRTYAALDRRNLGASMDASDPEAGTSHWRSAAETGRAEAFS